MSRKAEKILGAVILISMIVPIFTLGNHHDCQAHFDDCMIMYRDDRFGMCVLSAIDNLFMTMYVLWYLIILGGAMELSHDKNAVSPFVVISIFLAVAIWGAFVDPTKWPFVIAISISATLFLLAVYLDHKKTTVKKPSVPDA